jgi:hypothetical protein
VELRTAHRITVEPPAVQQFKTHLWRYVAQSITAFPLFFTLSPNPLDQNSAQDFPKWRTGLAQLGTGFLRRELVHTDLSTSTLVSLYVFQARRRNRIWDAAV